MVSRLSLWLVLLCCTFQCHYSFSVRNWRYGRQRVSICHLDAKADPLREATGVRPSLHPIVINALAEALRTRAEGNEKLPLEVGEGVEPMEVALSAGGIAAQAVANRQKTSGSDDMKLSPEEEQTVAGRIVGVIMRFGELENMLHSKCRSVGWIAKYNDWGSFGTLADESDISLVNERLQMDPLFAMSRAECLLALFLETVELPQLKLANTKAPDETVIDFIDDDRLEVLQGK